jgi:hypothetical protein
LSSSVHFSPVSWLRLICYYRQQPLPSYWASPPEIILTDIVNSKVEQSILETSVFPVAGCRGCTCDGSTPALNRVACASLWSLPNCCGGIQLQPSQRIWVVVDVELEEPDPKTVGQDFHLDNGPLPKCPCGIMLNDQDVDTTTIRPVQPFWTLDH